MLQRSVAGKDGFARQLHKGRTKTTGDRIQLTATDGQALVDAGLVFFRDSGTVGYGLTEAGVAFAVPHVKSNALDIEGCLRHILDLAYFHPSPRSNGEVAIPAIYVPGNSKLVLVLGENAGGKSFFRRLLQRTTHRGKKKQSGNGWAIKPGPFPVQEFIPRSIQGRTAGGFVQSMIYGVEEWQSTGENSAYTVIKGIKTLRGRTHPSIIFWDEPDIGMSAATAAGAGIALARFVREESPLVQAVCVTSHCAALLRPLRGPPDGLLSSWSSPPS